MRILILLALVGCKAEYSKTTDSRTMMQIDAESRTCTKDQLEMVKKYFDICSQTGYLDSHCVDRAMVAYCDKKKES